MLTCAGLPSQKKPAGIPGGDLASNGTQAFESWGLFLLLNDGMMLWEISVSDNILLPSGEPFAHQTKQNKKKK